MDVSLTRLVYRMTQADDKRRRASIWVAMACLVAVAVISPVSWPAIMTDSAKSDDGGVWGALYPVMVNGMSASGALVLRHLPSHG